MIVSLLSAFIFLQASTAPATAPSSDSELRRIIVSLQQQIAELRTENAAMKRENASLRAKVSKLLPPQKPGRRTPDDYKRLSAGMTMDNALAIMGQPQGRETLDKSVLLRWVYGGGPATDGRGNAIGETEAFHVDLTFEDDKLVHIRTYSD